MSVMFENPITGWELSRLVPMPRSGIQIHTPHVRIPERLVQHDAFLGGVRIWYPV